MMKNLKLLILALLMTANSTISFAQPENTEDGPPVQEVPIDGHLIFAIIVAITFAFILFNIKKKSQYIDTKL